MGKHQEILQLLKVWQEHGIKSKAMFEALCAVFPNSQDSAIHEEYWRLYTNYTAMVAAKVGDEYGWLEWYAWENNFGKRGHNAGPKNNSKPIKSLKDLIWLIYVEA